MSYVTHKFDVVEAYSCGRTATLEVWASPDESPYVEFTLRYSKGYESMGLEPAVAAQLAAALAQHTPIDAPALDDHDDSPVKLHVSWDADGADLLMVFVERRVRVVIDRDEQPDQIAQALRDCARELGLAVTG